MLLLQIQQTELIQFNDLHFKGVGDYSPTSFCDIGYFSDIPIRPLIRRNAEFIKNR